MGVENDGSDMSEFLVCYDLRNSPDEEEPNYMKLKEKLEDFQYSCRIQKSVWIVGGNHTKDDVFRILHKVMNEEDSLFVADYKTSNNHHGKTDFENCFKKRSTAKDLSLKLEEWGAAL